MDEAINWMENDETQTKADIDAKYNELEETLKPIMSKFY
jgi:molecular chaperone DnaK (HSP70)